MHQGAPHPTYGSSIFNLPPPQSNYGFGGGEGRDFFSDAINQTRQPWIPSGDAEEALSILMGFVPVAGTVYNWDQMQPWERALSIGMDAVDIATLGGGKLVTAPIKAGTRFATRGDPTLTFLRSGEMPTIQAGGDRAAWNYPSYGSYFDETLPPQGNFGPSMNYATRQPEVGISTYQGLQFPWDVSQGPNIFMRPMGTKGSQGQHLLWDKGQFTRPLYEIEGTPMKTLGSDLEALIDPATAQYVRKIKPVRNWENVPFKEPQIDFKVPGFITENVPGPIPGRTRTYLNEPTTINPVTGEVIDLGAEFAKYGPTGQRTNPLYRLDDVIAPWLKKPAIHPAVPVALPGRIPMQLYDNEANINEPPLLAMRRRAVRDASYG